MVYVQFVLSNQTFSLCFHQNPWLCFVNLLNLRFGKQQLHYSCINESYIHESFEQLSPKTTSTGNCAFRKREETFLHPELIHSSQNQTLSPLTNCFLILLSCTMGKMDGKRRHQWGVGIRRLVANVMKKIPFLGTFFLF